MQKTSESQSVSCRSPDMKKRKKTHTDENSSCQVSESKSSQPSYLEEPIRMCEGVKHFHCQFCEFGFFHIYSFNKHMLTHIVKKSFLCKMCGKAFSQDYNLKEHIKVHKDRNHILVKFVD